LQTIVSKQFTTDKQLIKLLEIYVPKIVFDPNPMSYKYSETTIEQAVESRLKIAFFMYDEKIILFDWFSIVNCFRYLWKSFKASCVQYILKFILYIECAGCIKNESDNFELYVSRVNIVIYWTLHFDVRI